MVRGLVTDVAGVRGALMEACDVVPLEQGNGWRTRGGKGAGTAITGATAGVTSHRALGLQENAGVYLGLHSCTVSGGTGLFPIFGVAAGAQLPSQVLVPAGTAMALTGRTAELAPERQADMEYGNELWLPSRSRHPIRWAGVAGSTEYTTGTVSGVAGARVVTGAGTTFTSAHRGGYLLVDDATVGLRAYRIVDVVSGTSLVVDRDLAATFNTKAFRISPVSWWSVKPGTFGGGYSPEDGGSPVVLAGGARSFLNAKDVTQHRNRPFAVNVIDADGKWYPNRFRWAATQFESDTLFEGNGEWGGAELWHPNAYEECMPGRGGSSLVAARSFGSTLYLFKQDGVFAVRGFFETDGRDVGMTIDVVTLEAGVHFGVPIVTEIGIFFAHRSGIWLVNEQGAECITDRDRVRVAFDDLLAGGNVAHVSWAKRRLIVQSVVARATAVTNDQPNTMVLDVEQKVWTQQRTHVTTPLVDIPNGAAVAVGVAGESNAGKATDWERDRSHSYSYDQATGEPVLASVTTHPFGLRGQVNGRLRGVRLRAKLVDDAGNDPAITAYVLLGEEGTTGAVEAAITGASLAETGTATEGWHRVAVRQGTPPVDTVRVRLVQTQRALDVRLYEVGVEHVPVGRIR